MSELNSYELSRAWFNYCFDNPEKIKPIHTAIYMFSIEHCNRLGWKEKFGFPSNMVMEAIGVKNWRTYSKALNDLVKWKFILMIETSKNQYSSNIIAIVKNTKAHTKALDKALLKHLQKQGTKQGQSTVSIDKQETKNKEQLNKEQEFDEFWDLYDKKINPTKCKPKFLKLSDKDRKLIMEYIPKYKLSQPEKKFRKDPLTFLNNYGWLDEIISSQEPDKPSNVLPISFRS